MPLPLRRDSARAPPASRGAPAVDRTPLALGKREASKGGREKPRAPGEFHSSQAHSPLSRGAPPGLCSAVGSSKPPGPCLACRRRFPAAADCCGRCCASPMGERELGAARLLACEARVRGRSRVTASALCNGGLPHLPGSSQHHRLRAPVWPGFQWTCSIMVLTEAQSAVLTSAVGFTEPELAVRRAHGGARRGGGGGRGVCHAPLLLKGSGASRRCFPRSVPCARGVPPGAVAAAGTAAACR